MKKEKQSASYHESYEEAEKLFADGSDEEALKKLNTLFKTEGFKEKSQDSIRQSAEKLKKEIEDKIAATEAANVKAEAEAQAKATAEANARNESVNLQAKVEAYRAEYPGGEDPSFTWDDAQYMISQVEGAEDGTFIYNGRRDVQMDDSGRRYYELSKQDPNAESNAEATFAYYFVYDDGTVEEQ